MNQSKKRSARLFVLVLICVGVAESLGAKNFSNYYNEVFHITAVQRGFGDFWRFPGKAPGSFVWCWWLLWAAWETSGCR